MKRFRPHTAVVLILVAFLMIGIGFPLAQGTFSGSANAAEGFTRWYFPVVLRNSIVTPPPVNLGGGSRSGVWIGGGGVDMVSSAKQAGAGWVRISISWSRIEPAYYASAHYDFSTYDSIFASISAAGLIPVVEIRGNPTWAATTTCGPIDRQGGIAAFDRFLRALVGRYGTSPYNAKHWEFYNEPDNTDIEKGLYYGGCWGDNPEKYAAMLQVANVAIKSVSPDSKILLGGLAHESSPDFNLSFLDEVLTAGADQYLDIVNIHYYSSQSPTWARYGLDIAGKVGAIRRTMANHGVMKPVVVTESSWTSSAGNAPNFREEQAKYVPKLFARGLAADVYAVIWFSLADYMGADVPYGLLDVAHNPKPSFQAYQVAAAEFSGANSIAVLPATMVGVNAGIEGYILDVDGQERWVLWSESGQVRISVPANASVAKNKVGQSIQLNNGSPTVIILDDSPIYLRF